MQLQLLACALSTEESDEWDCAWCCVVNKERHHPHATSAVVADSTPASCRDALRFGWGQRKRRLENAVWL